MTLALQPSSGLLPRFVCCLGLNVQLCRGSVLIIKSSEVGGDGCFDDCGQASFQGLLQEKARGGRVLYHRLDARSGWCECSLMRQSRDVSRSLIPDSGLACAECDLRHTVLRETRKEPFKRPLSKLVVDFSSSFLLQDRVAVHSQEAVDAANSQTLSEEGKFRLRVLTQLESFVHGSNDVCLVQELVRDVESCSWGCDALSRLFRGAEEKSISSLSSS